MPKGYRQQANVVFCANLSRNQRSWTSLHAKCPPCSFIIDLFTVACFQIPVKRHFKLKTLMITVTKKWDLPQILHMTAHAGILRFVHNCPTCMSNAMSKPTMKWTYFELKQAKFKGKCHLLCQSVSEPKTRLNFGYGHKMPMFNEYSLIQFAGYSVCSTNNPQPCLDPPNQNGSMAKSR